MNLRLIYLYAHYIIAKIRYYNIVKFRGFTIICARAGASITFLGGGNCKTLINSHFVSNMLGLHQRTYIYAEKGGKITIGRGCGISGTTINSMDEIIIGDYVRIGANCIIMDNDSHPLNKSRMYPTLADDIKHRPVRIGDESFIGANSIILKGTTIGKNCVVGAGSVVNGTYPDNVIIAGNPAKIIKENKPSFRYE